MGSTTDQSNAVSTMEERIREIMESEGLTQSEFSQKLKISPGSLSNIFNGRTKATINHTRAIHEAFPSLNVLWLQFGEGEMYNANSSNDSFDNAPKGGMGNNHPGTVKDVKKVEEPLDLFSSVNVSTPASVPHDAISPQETSNGIIKNLYNVRQREIKEIRIFYDDGTYESFVKHS